MRRIQLIVVSVVALSLCGCDYLLVLGSQFLSALPAIAANELAELVGDVQDSSTDESIVEE